MHIKQVFVRHDMGPFACDRQGTAHAWEAAACVYRAVHVQEKQLHRVHPCKVGYPCCGSSGMRV
eukprot:8329593-Pyramimonas_sp.AAC.1